MEITIPGRPVPKSYGLSKGRMYPKPKVKKQENKIAILWSDNHGRFQWMDNEYLAFSVRAYVKDKRHGDLKNYIFLAEDALSGVAYSDDKQIIRYEPVPFIDFCESEKQRTKIIIQEIEYDF